MHRLEGREGDIADVTKRGGQLIYGVANSEQFWATYKDGLSWTISTAQTPGGALDYFCYFRNTSSTRDVLITDIEMQGADILQVNVVTGTPSGGTDIVPVNRTIGSSNAISAVAQGAATIGGLTTVGLLERFQVTLPDSRPLQARPIYLPRQQNQTFGVGFQAVTGSIALNLQFDVVIRSADPEARF